MSVEYSHGISINKMIHTESYNIAKEEERASINQGHNVKAPMTVIGLVNGMVGSSCLVLHVIGITAGYLTTLWVCLLVGYLSYYTAYLIIVHLGKAKSIKESILAHF